MYREIIPFIDYYCPSDGKKLNVGCGRRFHPDWVNVDLQAQSEFVIECNVTKGLPFPENTFQAVYHSHLLEHLTPEQGRLLIEECYRVLEPGGVLRVVIPDLERIARLYLKMHDRAWAGDEEAFANYTWIKLELLDQMVRHQSGGMMGRYMASLDDLREGFVRSRIGAELDLCRQSNKSATPEIKLPEIVPTRRVRTWREKLSRRIIGWLLGQEGLEVYDETMFRRKGEIHRWMYDRYSLRQLCEQSGFVDFRVCAAGESKIASFNSFRLDSDGKKVFKPDSLFIECHKSKVGAMSVSNSPERKAA